MEAEFVNLETKFLFSSSCRVRRNHSRDTKKQETRIVAFQVCAIQ